MAIQFNLNALSRFSNVNFGDNDAIANLDGKDGLKQNEKLGFILTRKFRSADAERQNNAVRTELLKALANAFGIKDGIAVANGKTTFTDKFMSRLEEILGPEFKRGDFGIKDGVVDSGKPLTQRRETRRREREARGARPPGERQRRHPAFPVDPVEFDQLPRRCCRTQSNCRDGEDPTGRADAVVRQQP